MDKPCLESTTGSKQASGYYYFHDKVAGERRVHRWVYATTHNVRLTSDQVVRHLCNNKGCIEPTHLALDTTGKENAADKIANGTSPVGEKNPRAILTEKDVEWIRNNLHYSNGYLAKKFGVNHRTISAVRHNVSWSGEIC